jgi:hypothetical protein
MDKPVEAAVLAAADGSGSPLSPTLGTEPGGTDGVGR